MRKRDITYVEAENSNGRGLPEGIQTHPSLCFPPFSYNEVSYGYEKFVRINFIRLVVLTKLRMVTLTIVGLLICCIIPGSELYIVIVRPSRYSDSAVLTNESPILVLQ